MITVKELSQKLNCEIICGQTFADKVITGGYCSDMLSDVMGNASEGQIWITMQVHKNTIAVAMLKDLSAIILVNGSKPNEDTINTALQEGLAILTTNEPAFEIAAKAYKLLHGETY